MKEPKIKPISIDDTARLGIDKDGNLHWDGKPLKTEQKVTLSAWVNIAIIVSAVATVVLAACAIVALWI